MTQPRLLYIAFFYPPSRASGVYRALATTEVFIRAGWNVEVITGDEEFFEFEIGSADSSLLERVPDGANVARVPFSLSRHHRFPLSTAGRVAGYLPGPYLRIKESLAAATNEASFFPDKYRAWIEPVVERAKEIHAAVGYDHILATGNPYSSFEAARLASSDLDVPYSLDFRDPWTIDVITGGPTGSKQTRRAERRVVEEASNCFHVNQAIRDAYAINYREMETQHHVAMNGFDWDSLGPLHLPNRSGPLKFGMVGTVSDRWPLEALAAGWNKALTQLPDGSTLTLAGHLGFFGEGERALRTALPKRAFEYVGPIPKSQVGEFNAAMDVIVAPIPDGPLVTSGKIFEALAVGVPVVCIQSEGGGARSLLSDHPAAFGCDPKPDAIASALVASAKTAQKMEPTAPENIRQSMAHYERHASLAPMVAQIHQSYRSRSRR